VTGDSELSLTTPAVPRRTMRTDANTRFRYSVFEADEGRGSTHNSDVFFTVEQTRIISIAAKAENKIIWATGEQSRLCSLI